MNINQLFEQFVRGSAPQKQQQGGQQAPTGGVAEMLGQFTQGKAGGFAGGLAAGGLLGAVMGNKKMRKKAKKFAGGAVGYGGSAVLGALALKAYQNWQSSKDATPATASAPQGQPALPSPEKFDPALNNDATGQPMQLALVKAMIAAANADGHIDQEEQKAVFDAVDTMSLDAQSKAVVFDVLRNPPTVAQIAGYADGIEQASELYLASRLAIDPDETSERIYLDNLATAMGLPRELAYEIEMQVDPDQALPPRGGVAQFGRDESGSVPYRQSTPAVRQSGTL
ncbi:MAG: tellurite resistance TerB family protein [Ahrensia sp.]|nr:tellurite resistance TerB family protein [Ahrensia sp.]